MSTPNASLEGIPPEVRLDSYAYVLESDSTIEVCPKLAESTTSDSEVERSIYIGGPTARVTSGFRTNKELHPAILSSCRLIRREASEIFYKQNAFRFDTVSGATLLPRFLQAIGPLNASRIRSFTINIIHCEPLTDGGLEQTWQDVGAMTLLLKPKHHESRTLRFELTPFDPCSLGAPAGIFFNPNSDAAAGIQYTFHLAARNCLLRILDKSRKASTVLMTKTLSLGTIPRVQRGLLTDAFELATVTWPKNRSEISVTTAV